MFNQKRLYVIALCVYLVLTVLLFAQLSSPSVADPSHPPKDRPSYHDLFEEPVRDGKWTTSNWMSKLTDVLPNSSPFSTVHEPSELPWPRPPSPNPYRAPGTFLSDNHHLENNQWVPIDASIPPAPALLKTLQQGPEAAGPEYSWFQNRTVLLLSDSMGREHLHAFCTWWTFREPEIFGPQHESYPKFALEMEAKYSPGREYNFAMYGRPMRCHHEAWNFTMFYYFMGSFDDTAEQVEPGWSVGGFWDPRTAHWTPPVHPIDRVQSVMKPIMDSYGREPDLIEIGLSAWSLDAQKIADHDAAVREAVIAGRNQTEALEAGHLATKTHLSLDFVRTWRERLAEFVDQVRTLYGSKPPILYRLMQLTDQHYEYPKFFVDHRTATINNAAITVPTLEIDYWGDMIRGNEAFGDWIHPGVAPKYLWMEMMLFRLWEAVTDAADGRRYKMSGSRKAEEDGEISDL